MIKQITTIKILMLCILFFSTPAISRYQAPSKTKIENITKQLLTVGKINYTSVTFLNTNAEFTKNVIMINYITPLQEPDGGRNKELLSVAKVAGGINDYYGSNIDHSWITVQDHTGSTVANILVPADAASAYLENREFGIFLDTWVARFHDKAYFAGLQEIMDGVAKDRTKAITMAKVLTEISTAMKIGSKADSDPTQEFNAKIMQKAQKFIEGLIEDGALLAVETNTSNPLLFVGKFYPHLTSKLRNDFLKIIYDYFTVSGHQGMEKLILYDLQKAKRIGIFDKNGLKLDK